LLDLIEARIPIEVQAVALAAANVLLGMTACP
jgi:hypothetical protein